jgi:hypothetical protein
VTFINWSDSHEMLGLLAEYVVDERHEANDPARAAFLASVLEDLEELTAQVEEMTDDESIATLRVIQESVSEEFRGDTVLQHIQDCIEELERIRNRVMA